MQLCIRHYSICLHFWATILDKTYWNWPKLTIIMESPCPYIQCCFVDTSRSLLIDSTLIRGGVGGQKDIHLMVFGPVSNVVSEIVDVLIRSLEHATNNAINWFRYNYKWMHSLTPNSPFAHLYGIVGNWILKSAIFIIEFYE